MLHLDVEKSQIVYVEAKLQTGRLTPKVYDLTDSQLGCVNTGVRSLDLCNRNSMALGNGEERIPSLDGVFVRSGWSGFDSIWGCIAIIVSDNDIFVSMTGAALWIYQYDCLSFRLQLGYCTYLLVVVGISRVAVPGTNSNVSSSIRETAHEIF